MLWLFYIQDVRSLVDYRASVLAALSSIQQRMVEVIQNSHEDHAWGTGMNQ